MLFCSAYGRRRKKAIAGIILQLNATYAHVKRLRHRNFHYAFCLHTYPWLSGKLPSFVSASRLAHSLARDGIIKMQANIFPGGKGETRVRDGMGVRYAHMRPKCLICTQRHDTRGRDTHEYLRLVWFCNWENAQRESEREKKTLCDLQSSVFFPSFSSR